jgi:hypothetical protein
MSKIRRAAAFWIVWRRRMLDAGIPKRTQFKKSSRGVTDDVITD